VLKKLLSDEFHGRESLLEQLTNIEARTIDSNGSLELAPPDGARQAEVVGRIPVEAELDDRDGMKIHVLLHVVNGLLNELEIYREDSGSIQRDLNVDEFRLILSP
jgi:hypothetical protein